MCPWALSRVKWWVKLKARLIASGAKRPRDPGREGVGKRERGETGAKRVETGVRRVSPRLTG